MKTFFDSSAFAKRYIADQQSEEVDNLCARATSLAVSIICIPEIISALARLNRESRITANQLKKGKEALLRDLSDAIICTLNSGVINQTIHVLENSSTRAMDAIHIACALEWQAEIFVSADHQQCLAAKKLGLLVATIG